MFFSQREAGMSDGLILQRISLRHELPRSCPERPSPRGPAWVERLARAMVRGMVPVVPFSEIVQQRDRYVPAAQLDCVVHDWRDDGADVWTAVSVWLEEDSEGEIYW